MGRKSTEFDHLHAHERVCTERYGNINQQLQEIKSQMLSFNSGTNDRLNALSNRMWILLSASLGGTVMAVGALAFYMITTKGHP